MALPAWAFGVVTLAVAAATALCLLGYFATACFQARRGIYNQSKVKV